MVQNSDRQLALGILGKLPWLTLGFLVFQCGVFAALGINDANASVFALNHTDDSALRHWAFDANAPLRNFGLNLISSLFVHANAEHFLTNGALAVIVLPAAERRLGVAPLSATLILGHFASLLGAFAAHRYLDQQSLAAGMSGAVLAAAALYLGVRLKKLAIPAFVVLCGVYALTALSAAVVHAPAAAIGLLFSLRTKEKQVERPSSAR